VKQTDVFIINIPTLPNDYLIISFICAHIDAITLQRGKYDPGLFRYIRTLLEIEDKVYLLLNKERREIE